MKFFPGRPIFGGRTGFSFHGSEEGAVFSVGFSAAPDLGLLRHGRCAPPRCLRPPGPGRVGGRDL